MRESNNENEIISEEESSEMSKESSEFDNTNNRKAKKNCNNKQLNCFRGSFPSKNPNYDYNEKIVIKSPDRGKI